MRDPDSQPQGHDGFHEREARPGPETAMSSGFYAEQTEPHYALGTQQGDRVGPLDDGSDDAALDLATIPRATLVFDADRRIADLNRVAETLLGYARDDLVGEPIDLVASKLASVRHHGRIRFVAASAGACVHHRSGRTIAVDALLCPHGEQSTVAVLRVVETSQAGLREDDVAQIVHDLKSPLSTIALEASVLDHNLAVGTPPAVRGALARITRNVEFLDRMVHDLLDLCSVEAGRLELHRRPTELRTLLARIIERVVPTRDRARVFFQAEGPMTMSIDDLRIERVVANLVQNALKYAPRTSCIVVQLAAVTDAIQISVTDAGPGMSPDETGVVFDKFRRAGTASDHDGSGLGLYVSKKIIEAHGGRIAVASMSGAGSRFFFELPVA